MDMVRLSGKKPIWGLDIGASAIKGVRMCLEGDRVKILAADILPLEGEAVPTESPGRDRRIWRGLQRFQAKYGLSSERVALGLPGPVFFIRPFNLLPIGDRSPEELVRFEIEQHIPFGLDAVLWDYELFDQGSGTRKGREGLLFAMKKEVLNNYLLSLSAAGMEPVHAQAAPLALYQFVRYELDPRAPVLVVDIGAASTDLLLLDGDRYWVRAIHLGGDALTRTLQRAFLPRELSREDAESMKVNLPRLSGRGKVTELIRGAMRGFVGELRNAVEHLSKERSVKFERVILVGGGTGMYGLPRLVGEQLGARVVTPAGLGRITVAESADAAYVNANLPSLAPAIGLGLQALGKAATRVNMIGATLVRRRSQTRAKRIAASILVAAAVLVLLLGAFAGLRKRVVHAGLNEMSNILGPIRVRHRRYRDQIAPGEAERRLGVFRDMATGRGVWLTVLDKVARMLPENESRGLPKEKKLWLRRLSLKARPGSPGVYDGLIEAGTLLQEGAAHLHFAKRTLVYPLRGDPRGIFKHVGIISSVRSPGLGTSRAGGPDRYFIVRLKFEVVLKEGDAR